MYHYIQYISINSFINVINIYYNVTINIYYINIKYYISFVNLYFSGSVTYRTLILITVLVLSTSVICYCVVMLVFMY